jgi:transcriptional regulator with PAS, ATPase and Fis domain
LYHWTAANGRTQVVSTASKCLMPMLGAGTFNDGLYYRLNVVLLGPPSR